MDAGARIGAASTVLLGGLLLAMLFRHAAPATGPPPPEIGDRLVLRKRMEPQRAAEAAPTHGARERHAAFAPAASPTPGREPTLLKPTTLKPMGPGKLPPVLARDYPGDAVLEGLDGTPAPGTRSPGFWAEGRSRRVHKVADGDTLQTLAEQYLGSADRFSEIYEANRDLLSSPEILPIGVELQIPPGPSQSPSPSNFMPKRPLLPVSDNEDDK
jgi:nucleoid-associated protein YgaU